jgi:hypothetical protein
MIHARLGQSLCAFVFAKHGKFFGVREFTAMRMNYRLFLSSFLPVLFLLGGSAVVGAQKESSSTGKGGHWSDPATWPDRKVPVAGDKVTIEKGKDVVLDVSPPALGSLTINGKLSFADNKDLELTTEWIMVHGELEIGTEKAPHTRKAPTTSKTKT